MPFTLAATAKSPEPTHPCEVLRVVDGDTLEIRVILPFGIEAHDDARMIGINCPEHGTPEGDKATAYTKQWLVDHKPPYAFAGHTRDKYGRLLGQVRAADAACLNDDLLTSGNAKVMK
jgi:endonuclease YncB( thermonuclease family)